jgi:hypothetical protein
LPPADKVGEDKGQGKRKCGRNESGKSAKPCKKSQT